VADIKALNTLRGGGKAEAVAQGLKAGNHSLTRGKAAGEVLLCRARRQLQPFGAGAAHRGFDLHLAAQGLADGGREHIGFFRRDFRHNFPWQIGNAAATQIQL